MWRNLLDWLPSWQLSLMPQPAVASPGCSGAMLPSVWQRVAADPALARLADGLERCGLHTLLDGEQAFTLFAPANAGLDRAAARLGLGAGQLWRQPEALRPLLLHHVADGAWPSGRLPWPGELPSLAGRPLRLTALGLLRSGDLALALAAGSDQPCRNGVLHRLPEALLPPDD